jgi:AraC-like DNA-binding protein
MSNDALSQILGALRMQGTVYFQTYFTPPWGVFVPEYKNVARFHMAMRGQCWVRIDGEPEPIHMSAGDLVAIPHGRAHIMSDAPDREAVLVDEVVSRSGYTGSGALVYGGRPSGPATQLFSGHFEFDDNVMHPLLSALPRYIHIPNTETMNAEWLDAVMRFVTAEVMGAKPGAEAIVHRLTEIIFIQVVRAFVDKTGDAAGCLAGVLDPQLNKALAAMHSAPEKPWTVDAIAVEAGMSRTKFAERFRTLIGLTPLVYLTRWRMQLARRQLIESDRPLIEIAETAGYRSESAFAHAFKRHFSVAPGRLRRQRD